jgi:cation:H+ antiporter
LPELATSVVAAIRGQRDLAVGNAIGSNLFNLLAVLGLTAVVSPDAIPIASSAVRVDIPVMIAAAFACLPIFVNGYAIKRWEGILFFLLYGGYVTWVVLDGTDHVGRDTYGAVMVFFVLPITALTLAVVWYRSRRPQPFSP